MLLEIGSLPLVTSVKLGGEPGDKPTNIKVYANVKADFVTPPKSRQPKVCCSKQLPTQLDAARALLANLHKSGKGGYAEELAAAAAAAAKAEPAAGSGARLHCCLAMVASRLPASCGLLAIPFQGRVAARTRATATSRC